MNKPPKDLSAAMLYYINITNLPPSIKEDNLLELINSIIQTNLEFEINYKLVEFIIEKNEKEEEDKEEEEELLEVSAILQFDQYYHCLSLYNILNGYEWLNKIINVEVINNPQDKNVIQHHQPYYDPYYPCYQYGYNHPVVAPGAPPPGRAPAPYPNQVPPPFYYQPRKSSDSEETKTNPDYILVKNDEDDELIKVNPCRLFIGNVPYSSNWTSLRNFLLVKSKEMDPTSNLGILRVEIPIQTVNARSKSDSYALPTYPNFDEKVDMNMQMNMQMNGHNRKNMTKSRGFAIVITSDKESAVKLIEMLDNVEFEGRSLTVRFDKFPDYNNYVIQQLNTSFGNRIHNNNNIINNNQTQNNLPRNNALLSNLAFERNLLQQKLYYNNLVYPYYNPMYYPQGNYYDKRKNYNYETFRNINYNSPNYMPSQYPYNGQPNKPVNGNYPYQPQYRTTEESTPDLSTEATDSLKNLKLNQ